MELGHPLGLAACGRLPGRDVAERDRLRAVVAIQLDRIIAEGFDPQFGARPLKRYLERQIVNPLSRMILAGEASDGAEILVGLGHETGLRLAVGPPALQAPAGDG